MNKIGIQNLGLIVTNRCNLDCAHCMRGCKNSNDMKKDVIDAILDQIKVINNLCLCGGEITFATNTLEYIFEGIIKRKIFIEYVTTVINGTNYSDEFLRLLEFINEYILKYTDNDHLPTSFTISEDYYHIKEMGRLNIYRKYLENIRKYEQSIYFAGMQGLNPDLKLFREGNAEHLDKYLTTNLRPMKTCATYVRNNGKFDRNGMFYVGPLVTVNTDGIITECDASLEHMQTKYNYGNVLDESIEDVMKRKSKIRKPDTCYKHWCSETKKYETYN